MVWLVFSNPNLFEKGFDQWLDNFVFYCLFWFTQNPTELHWTSCPCQTSHVQVELPILEGLRTKGVQRLETLGTGNLMAPILGNQDARGNKIMNQVGVSFRKWCRQQKLETPPSTWNLHLVGRGDNDSKNAYPVLDSNVKAAHTKPILFFLSFLATEISSLCGCPWV